MLLEATGTGKTVEEAMEDAKRQLGIEEGADYEILDITQPQKKTFGLFGGSPAMVKLGIQTKDPKMRKASSVQKSEKEKSEKENKPKDQIKKESAGKPVAGKPVAVKAFEKQQPEQTTDQQPVPTAVEDTVVYLQQVLAAMGVDHLSVQAVQVEDGYELDFDGKGLGVAIGRKGETLDALQHLCALVANRAHDGYLRITLNPAGYRQRRAKTLTDLAVRDAQKAKETQRNIILEPMNAYERRIIHNAVQAVEGVESWSIGEDNHRRVCIGTSRDNKPLREYNRSRSSDRERRRSRRSDDRRRSVRVTPPAEPTRAPRKDSDDLPLYGVISKPQD